MIIPLMAADLFGLQRMGRVMGIVLTADGVAEAVVPMAVATLRDRTGSYGPGFALLVALAVLGAGAPVVACLPVYKSRPERTELGRGRTHSTLGQQASPRGQQEGKAGGQGGAPRPARGREEAEGPRRRRRRIPIIAGIVPGPQPLPWGDDEPPS